MILAVTAVTQGYSSVPCGGLIAAVLFALWRMILAVAPEGPVRVMGTSFLWVVAALCDLLAPGLPARWQAKDARCFFVQALVKAVVESIVVDRDPR